MLFGPVDLQLLLHSRLPEAAFQLHCNSTIFVWLPLLGARRADRSISLMSLLAQGPDGPVAPSSPMGLWPPAPRRACDPSTPTGALPKPVGSIYCFFTCVWTLLVWLRA